MARLDTGEMDADDEETGVSGNKRKEQESTRYINYIDIMSVWIKV